eukprot:SAG31_NODE_967_length_10684_cov_58.582239_12_plen_87_part_00
MYTAVLRLNLVLQVPGTSKFKFIIRYNSSHPHDCAILSLLNKLERASAAAAGRTHAHAATHRAAMPVPPWFLPRPEPGPRPQAARR